MLSGVNAGDGDQLPDQGPQVPDIVDLLADDIGSCHIGVAGDGTQGADLVLDHLLGLYLIPDDGQRNAAEGSEEAEHHAGLLCNGGHAGVDLPQKSGSLFRLDQTCVGNLHVADAPFAAASGDPEQFILQ